MWWLNVSISSCEIGTEENRMHNGGEMTLQEEIVRLAQVQKAAEEAHVAKSLIDIHVKILSASYDKSIAYTNLIIFGGYAFYFALWSHLNGHLTPKQELWSGLIMSASAGLFVFYEVFKMYIGTAFLEKYRALVQDSTLQNNGSELLKKLQAFDAQSERERVLFNRFWFWQFLAVIATAIIGIGIFVYAMVYGLVMAYREYP